jgi:hypothetical protein
MFPRLLLLLSLSSVFWQVSCDQQTIPTSSIQSILLYTNTAQIIRLFTTPKLPSGYHHITLENLPSNLLDESIHLQSLPCIHILSSSVTTQQISREQDGTYHQIESVIHIIKKKLQTKVEHLLNEQSRIEMRVEVLDKYLTSLFSSQQLNTQYTSLQNILEIMNQKDEEIAKRNQKIEELSIQLNSLNEMIAELKSILQAMTATGSYSPFPCEEFKGKLDLKEVDGIDCSLLPQSLISWPSSRTLKVLSMHVYVSEEQTKLTEHPYSLTYLTETGAATWSPQYDIQYEGDIDQNDFTYTLKIELYAHLDQNTGESQHFLSLSLSELTRGGLEEYSIDFINLSSNSTHPTTRE